MKCLTSGGTIFRSRNSTSMMNFPVNRVSIAHMKSSLFFSCLSIIPARNIVYTSYSPMYLCPSSVCYLHDHYKAYNTKLGHLKRPGWIIVLRLGEEEDTSLTMKEATGGCSLVMVDTSGYSFTNSCLFLSTVRYLPIITNKRYEH